MKQGKVSLETQAGLAHLVQAANEGLVLGYAAVVILKGDQFFIDYAGIATDNLTKTRGMVCALDDELRALVQQRAQNANTL